MSGDGHIGGGKLLCGKDDVPQKKVSTKDRHFTVLPLCLLSGEPLICIVIIAGKRPSALLEMGLDGESQLIGDVNDNNFWQNNSGPGKLFPGGPTCTVCSIALFAGVTMAPSHLKSLLMHLVN